MFDVKFKLLQNRYIGKSQRELQKIYDDKRAKYYEMMKVLNPVTMGSDFLELSDAPLWVKIAHVDEFLECPYCLEEYRRKVEGDVN